MLANNCSPGEGSGLYNIAARCSACIDKMVIINCKGINTDDPLTAAGSKFYHWFNAGLRGIAFSSRRSSRWGTFSHRWHSLNRPGGATENYRWLVSTFITMGPYIHHYGSVHYYERWGDKWLCHFIPLPDYERLLSLKKRPIDTIYN
jgi:hypothetical protein